MTEEPLLAPQSLSTEAARLLATTTKSAPQYIGSSPRWLVQFLPWRALEAGTFRINRLRVTAPPARLVSVIDEGAETTITAAALRSVPALQYVAAEFLETMAGAMSAEQHPAGAEVYDGEGDSPFVIVVSGKIEALDRDPHGITVRRALLGPGSHLGQETLDAEPEPTPSIRAVTPVTLLVLTRSRWEELTAGQEDVRILCANGRRPPPGVNAFGEQVPDVQSGHEGEVDVPRTFVDYDHAPREIGLNLVQTVLQMHTRVTDIYNSPHDQLDQQMRLTVEGMRERQEWDLINDPHTGLLGQVTESMRIPTRLGAPTPDDFDEMLSMVWKEPAFFLAHPRAIAAFGRECTRRGVPPPTVQLHGSPFMTWRGVPIVPTDKLAVNARGASHRTQVVLMRVGEERQGVIGLHQPGLPGEDPRVPSMSIHRMGINRQAIESYLLSLYSSVAVMADDAVAVLTDVEVARYHAYE